MHTHNQVTERNYDKLWNKVHACMEKGEQVTFDTYEVRYICIHHTHAWACLCTYVWVYAYMHAYVCKRALMTHEHIYMYTRAFDIYEVTYQDTYLYSTLTHRHVYVDVFVCMYICMHVCERGQLEDVYDTYIHICTYIYIYGRALYKICVVICYLIYVERMCIHIYPRVRRRP